MSGRTAWRVLALCCTIAACTRGEARPAATPDAAETTAEALHRQGLTWAGRGDMIRAERYLALAVRAGYPERRALVALIEVCLRASRLRAALNHAEPYLRRHPDAWRVRYLVASIHLALDNPRRALEELGRVAADERAGAETHYAHGRLLLDTGAGDAARASFATYLQLAPDGPHAAEARLALREATGDVR